MQAPLVRAACNEWGGSSWRSDWRTAALTVRQGGRCPGTRAHPTLQMGVCSTRLLHVCWRMLQRVRHRDGAAVIGLCSFCPLCGVCSGSKHARGWGRCRMHHPRDARHATSTSSTTVRCMHSCMHVRPHGGVLPTATQKRALFALRCCTACFPSRSMHGPSWTLARPHCMPADKAMTGWRHGVHDEGNSVNGWLDMRVRVPAALLRAVGEAPSTRRPMGQHGDFVRCMHMAWPHAVTACGSTARHDCAVRVFDLTRGSCALELPTDQGPIWAMDWDPAAHRVAAGCSDEAVDYWDADPRDALAGSRVLLKVGRWAQRISA